MLRCDGLRKTFNGVVALDGVSVTVGQSVPPHDRAHGGSSGDVGIPIVAIVGPNGAGKTTLINVLTGFVRSDAGSYFLEGEDITGLAPHQVARAGVARMFQELRLIGRLSAVEHVMLAGAKRGDDSLWRAVIRVGVNSRERSNRDKAMRLLDFVGLSGEARTLVGALSYGQQKLVALASCVGTEAKWLMLDEPVSGLHPDLRDRIIILLRELRQAGKQVVFIEHDMDAVRSVADRVLVMDEGRLIADGPANAVLAQPEILEVYID